MKQRQTKDPIISVVIPTYNRKELLRKCLGALFKQTYPRKNFEIIIVDDGSTDDTQAKIKTLMKKHQNLRYFKQKNQGPAAARNLGIKHAQGEIVAFIDDDCWAKKDWLKQIDQAFRKNPKALGQLAKKVFFFLLKIF